VAALGHPRHVLAPPLGIETVAEHAGTQLGAHFLAFVEMGIGLVAGLMQRLQRRAGELELPAGLQRDVATVARERDRLAGFFYRLPPEPSEAFEQRADAGALTLVGQRPQIVEAENEFLVLRTDAPTRRRLGALRDVLDELALVGDEMAATGRRCRHERAFCC